MAYDITFSVPQQNGKCTATLHETDESANKTGKSWSAPFNYANREDAEKLAALKKSLYDQVKAEEAEAVKQDELRTAAVNAGLTIKPAK